MQRALNNIMVIDRILSVSIPDSLLITINFIPNQALTFASA